MRVGIDASSVGFGGVLHHLIELLNHVEPSEYSITEIIVFGNTRVLSQLPKYPWLRTIDVPQLNGSFWSVTFWKLFRLGKLAHQHCDILFTVVANSPNFHPYVSICQNQLVFEPTLRALYGFTSSRLRLEILACLHKRSYQRADGTIFLTQFSRASAFKQINISADNTTVIPHGINTHFVHTHPVAEPLRKPQIRILYPSTIDLYKNQWVVAEAILKLHLLGYQVHLDVVGYIFSQQAYEQLQAVLKTNPSSSDIITYHGEVPYLTMKEFYERADIVVFASSCETFGMILLEAMAMKKAIACSNQSSLPETLQDAGLYFDPTQTDSLVEVLEALINQPMLRKELSEKAFVRASGYSWEKCAHQTFEFIRKTYLDYQAITTKKQ
ncbi:MAG: glycosyltransferase family 1 protein [Spirosomataceae bacterium]